MTRKPSQMRPGARWSTGAIVLAVVLACFGLAIVAAFIVFVSSISVMGSNK